MTKRRTSEILCEAAWLVVDRRLLSMNGAVAQVTG